MERLRFGVAHDAEERHGSWLELFFDLMFMVAVAELANTLDHHPTSHGFVRYLALFLPVCWAWVGYTFVADRWQSEDTLHKALMIVAMLVVAFLALAIPHAFSGDAGSIRFALRYSAVRLLLIILYARAYRTDPSARPLTGRYLLGFTAGLLLWLSSAAAPLPQRHWLWAAGFTVELATPLLSARAISRVTQGGVGRVVVRVQPTVRRPFRCKGALGGLRRLRGCPAAWGVRPRPVAALAAAGRRAGAARRG